MPPSK